MPARISAIKFSEPEYRALTKIARRRRKTVAKVVKDAVSIVYFKPARASLRRKKMDFSKLPSFGIWKDDPRSDGEILNDLGRIWNGIYSP